jgi:hypothetical protein
MADKHLEELDEVEPVTDENDLGEGPPVDCDDEFPDEADTQ